MRIIKFLLVAALDQGVREFVSAICDTYCIAYSGLLGVCYQGQLILFLIEVRDDLVFWIFSCAKKLNQVSIILHR